MAPPFNPNTTSPAASDLISAFPSDEQGFRAAVVAWLTFLSDPTTGIIKIAALPSAATDIPTGTKMLFVQTDAPTGWSKDTTHNDKSLRVVNGTASSGGTNTFSSTFTTVNTSAVSLTIAQLPAHTHNYSGTTGTENQAHNHGFSGAGSTDAQGTHTHTFTIWSGDGGRTDGPGGNGSPSPTGTITTAAAGNHAHNVSVSGTTATENQAHNHGFSGTTDGGNALAGSSHLHTTDLRVQYVDVIICTRA